MRWFSLSSIAKKLFSKESAALPRDLFRNAFAEFAGETAIISSGGKFTYQDLEQRVSRLCIGMENRGISRGKLVFLHLQDGNELVECLLAAWRIGAIAVPFNSGCRQLDVIRAGRSVQPDMFIYDPALGQGSANYFSGDLDKTRLLSTGKNGSYERLILSSDLKQDESEIYHEDPAILHFVLEPGSELRAMYFTQQAVFSGLLVNRTELPGSGRQCLLGMPLNDSGGELGLAVLLNGGTLFVPPQYSPKVLLTAIQRFRINTLLLTPARLMGLLDAPELARYDISSLKTVLHCGGYMPAVKLKEAIERYGAIFRQAYTIRESQLIISALTPEDHISSGNPPARKKLTSVGELQNDVQLRIEYQDRKMAPGEVGDILVKNNAMIGGYWKRPDLDRRYLTDGWIQTGDVGFMQSNGLLFILNRRNDLICQGSKVIYPRLIEEIVYEHPAVKEACYLRDEKTGKLMLSVSLRSSWQYAWNVTHRDLQVFLSGRIEDWKMPDEILSVSEMPWDFGGRRAQEGVQIMLNRRKSVGTIPFWIFQEDLAATAAKKQPSSLAS